MRISILHSFYRTGQPSGENTSVLELEKSLRLAGHQVTVVSAATDSLMKKPLYRLSSAANVVSWRGIDPTRMLADSQPDIVHVHNTFPNFSAAWIRSWPGPVVHTIHNFRPICANGLLYRGNGVCLDCPEGDSWSAVRHACYRGSRLATLPLAVRNSRGLSDNPLVSHTDAVVLLSEQAKATYVKYGLDAGRAHVVPNGWEVATGNAVTPHPNGRRWLAAGRLTSEKGFLDLVTLWPEGEILDIYGDGPERRDIEASKRPGVNLVGAVPRQELLDAMPGYAGLILPSLCLEMQPSVLVEALALGLPVVARSGGAAEALVSEHGVGFAYDSTQSLLAALHSVTEGGSRLRSRARAVYLRNFTPEIWIQRLESVYRQATEAHALRRCEK